MLSLDYNNRFIHDLLTERFQTDNPSSIDQVVTDFDGVTFHISTPESKTKILISLYMKCFSELVNYGTLDLLNQIYGPYVHSPVETGYNFSIVIDLEQLPSTQEEREQLIISASLLKRNALAAPFHSAFAKQAELAEMVKKDPESTVLLNKQSVSQNYMAIHYRDEEMIVLWPEHDRVTVVFSTKFLEEADRIFGKVFLQEFVDARRRPSIQTAPQVLFSYREPPLEIRNVGGIQNEDEDSGFVTFVLFERHFTPQVREDCISHIQIFRNTLHYHIKASKAYMHQRMRKRVADFQKVLNRAKPDVKIERKTASGRSFVHA
ncbi:ARP2/3 actin-organizing complex subunit Arc34 [Schizosaccharomyces cryophilus OY26]|uniref:Arp2/3 complex 34 kDa subunit n=1 Tax=Schizosaccharomyces cryophilus (strain OY26 / ATCC MYA-4695 / CBS 11777 / NBRC 106824 / NRRL Y48691) TaxID=653667 RepID=S9VZU0_SCHCR|nr:ARP2/3 actin-organizing complex subunit Arc34 [Schizosaccharomyces cryophilus OY26]EPY53203.1 ARP2/3 actin-organizing complex subunit Arc34 [Schizosaccharomyces cryophilus OY26]